MTIEQYENKKIQPSEKRMKSAVHRLMLVMLMLISILSSGMAQALETVVHYHNDPSGSPLAATDQDGNVLWKESYWPYGDRTKKQDGGANALWFAGKTQDDITGLSYFGPRYYDSVIGRFMGIDPQEFSEGNIHSFNRYAYANNNPYRYIDPNGRSPVDIGFFVYDAFRLGQAIYLGQGVGAAALDAGLSTLGVLSPIPGVGQVMKGWRAAERAEEAVRVIEHAAESASAAKAVEVTAAQAKNIDRFTSKLPANAKDNVSLKALPNDGVAAQAVSPGRVPGSSAVYEKQIDAAGKTIQYTKTTYDPAGNIVHVKDKITGGMHQ